MIRRAALNDAGLIATLGRKTFDDTFRGTCTDEDLEEVLQLYFNLKQVQQELQDPNDVFLLLLDKDEPAGYSRMKLDDAPPHVFFEEKKSVELKRIYLDKEYHGKGLAQKLMQENIELARQNNFERIYLSVWEHNLRAQKFYVKTGFRNSGIENPFPLGETPQMDYWFYLDL